MLLLVLRISATRHDRQNSTLLILPKSADQQLAFALNADGHRALVQCLLGRAGERPKAIGSVLCANSIRM